MVGIHLFKDCGRDFFVGVRPEHLSIAVPHAPHAVSAEVEFVEPLGQTTSLHLQAEVGAVHAGHRPYERDRGRDVSVVAAADHVRVSKRAARSATRCDQDRLAPVGQVSPTRKPFGNGSVGSSTY